MPRIVNAQNKMKLLNLQKRKNIFKQPERTDILFRNTYHSTTDLKQDKMTEARKCSLQKETTTTTTNKSNKNTSYKNQDGGFPKQQGPVPVPPCVCLPACVHDVYVCMCICVYVCMYICVWSVNVCAHVHVCVCMYICVHACTCGYAYVCACMCTGMCVHIYVHVGTCVCMFAYMCVWCVRVGPCTWRSELNSGGVPQA